MGPKLLLCWMSLHVNLLLVKYQLFLGYVYQRTGQAGNDTRPKITRPSSNVTAHKPLASKIPAYFGFCVPTHRIREWDKASHWLLLGFWCWLARELNEIQKQPADSCNSRMIHGCWIGYKRQAKETKPKITKVVIKYILIIVSSKYEE